MQGYPTVVLVCMHSPHVEYAGVPHNDTFPYALLTVEYAGLPYVGTHLYALPTSV
jgi:hypothetical protein